jgi:hypothetical protein
MEKVTFKLLIKFGDYLEASRRGYCFLVYLSLSLSLSPLAIYIKFLVANPERICKYSNERFSLNRISIWGMKSRRMEIAFSLWAIERRFQYPEYMASDDRMIEE